MTLIFLFLPFVNFKGLKCFHFFFLKKCDFECIAIETLQIEMQREKNLIFKPRICRILK